MAWGDGRTTWQAMPTTVWPVASAISAAAASQPSCLRELTTTVVGDRALTVTDILTDGWYDYDAKYKEGGSKHVCPAKISLNIYQKITTLALKAHQAFGCRGVTRSDFRYDDRCQESTGWLQ